MDQYQPLVKHRDSNLELFRIIAMLLIVAHHYVVNSGLTAPDGPIYNNPLSRDSLFLMIFGAWGKIGINCFVMITGYFMCTSNITAKKFFKLVLIILFYQIIIGLIFILSGYQPLEWKSFIKLFIPIRSVKQNFSGFFIIFFLFIPFLNIVIKHINEKKHIYLFLVCVFTYVLFGSFHQVDMNYVSWFIVLYVTASYIRLYPKKWFSNNRICGSLAALFVILSALSVWLGTYWGLHVGKNLTYFFVSDSNTIMAFLTGVFTFLFFKNLKLRYSRFINGVAATTFGILLIHANSDTMRQWLWKDTLDNVGHYGQITHALLSVLIVFAVCSFIDFLRIKLIEKPFFDLWDKKQEMVYGFFKRKEDKMFQKK